MRPTPRSPQRLATLLLAFWLLAAQWLGITHRIEHGAALGGAPQAAAQATAHPVDDAHVEHADHGHQPGSATCLLLDHALAQADAWLPAALPWGVAGTADAPVGSAPGALLRKEALAYLARGPPPALA